MDTAATPSHIASPGVAYTPLDLAFCAVGRPIETRRAEWMAAVLTCGSGAALSDQSGGALWDITEERDGVIHVTVRPHRDIRQPSLVAHRRWTLDPADVTVQDGIPVTTPLRTLIDLATEIPRDELEAAINEAEKLDLINPESLRRALDERRGQGGVGVLRRVLDLRTFRLTDSQLEQQAKDRLRDQAHAAAGLASLRFTHGQIRFEPERVESTLTAVARRVSATVGD